ncbi:MAG: hypothetical protein CM15mP120_11850 [Pseudomonadota bacterium]|nr:MAG: hypothetical protein CM15mP120_11850 [Pseudomonadota bacterium]
MSNEDFSVLYQKMLPSPGQLGGELALVEPLPDGAWTGVTTGHRGCSNNPVLFQAMRFFSLRVIGARMFCRQSDLVFGLSLGGGAVLPGPKTILCLMKRITWR